MKEHQILFKGPMVIAILDGRKSQTRRLSGLEKINENPDDWQFEWADFALKLPWRFTQKSTVNEISLKNRDFYQEAIKCPYGRAGDVLWVRETFGWYGNIISGSYGFVSPEEPRWPPCVMKGGFRRPIIYKADYPKHRFDPDDSGWKPSIHMPKTACRIWLEIIFVKVERLQDISERDAIKEGVELQLPSHLWKNYRPETEPKEGFSSPFSSYETLWRQINGVESWNSNPWVWVIEFKIKEILT